MPPRLSALLRFVDLSRRARLASGYRNGARANRTYRCFQVAFGGGEPLLHPHLEHILARCHELGLVPNLTTSGLNLGTRELDFLARYCGAIGVSLEGVEDNFATVRKSGFARFERVVSKLQGHGIPVVLQVTLSSRILAMLPEIVAYCARQSDLYGVIFLAYKPVGRGRDFDQPLSTLSHLEVHEHLQHAFEALSQQTRVGFDCCMTPAVTGRGNDYDPHAAYYLEGCSALRTSIGLSPTLDVMPCTFTAEHSVGNLHEQRYGKFGQDSTANNSEPTWPRDRGKTRAAQAAPSIVIA